MREKLIELIEQCSCCYSPPCTGECAECNNVEMHDEEIAKIADHLIANGVTIQKWIPVTERLPEEDGIYIVRTVHGTLTTARFYAFKYFPKTKYVPEVHRSPSWQANRNVTHWMPLPEPPKGAA